MTKVFIYIKEGLISNLAGLRKAFTLKDGRYEVTIKRAGKRSLQQNRYYHGVVVEMVHEGLRDMGHEVSKEEVHEWLKSKFNYKEIINEQTGQYERIPLSTTALSKEDFGIYIEKIQQFAAEFLNVVIPNPGSQSAIEFQT